MANRPCPLCGTPTPRVAFTRNGFAVLACAECGLRFLHPQPGERERHGLYGEAYFSRTEAGQPGYDCYLAEIDQIRRTFANRLALLPAQHDSSRLLDVGAAVGLFVEQARRTGWVAEGVEPSAWAAGYAREVLGQPVRTSTLEEALFPAGSFDVVTLWEVIEHLPDPRATLGEAARILRPGGLLALSTPDAGSAVARMLGRRWPGWSKIPEHLYFFDRTTLRRILEGCGLRIEVMRYVSLVVSRGYLLDRIGQLTGFNLRRRFPANWLKRAVTLNPLYDLFVLARRA